MTKTEVRQAIAPVLAELNKLKHQFGFDLRIVELELADTKRNPDGLEEIVPGFRRSDVITVDIRLCHNAATDAPYSGHPLTDCFATRPCME